MMSFNEKAKIVEDTTPKSAFRPNLNNTGFAKLHRLFTKITPAQLEACLIMVVSGFAAFTVLRNDVVMPGYSKVVQGDKESYGSDPVDTYRMEPIFDDNGKLKAMRKIRIKKEEVENGGA